MHLNKQFCIQFQVVHRAPRIHPWYPNSVLGVQGKSFPLSCVFLHLPALGIPGRNTSHCAKGTRKASASPILSPTLALSLQSILGTFVIPYGSLCWTWRFSTTLHKEIRFRRKTCGEGSDVWTVEKQCSKGWREHKTS